VPGTAFSEKEAKGSQPKAVMTLLKGAWHRFADFSHR
jgi:hypothetical protein